MRLRRTAIIVAAAGVSLLPGVAAQASTQAPPAAGSAFRAAQDGQVGPSLALAPYKCIVLERDGWHCMGSGLAWRLVTPSQARQLHVPLQSVQVDSSDTGYVITPMGKIISS